MTPSFPNGRIRAYQTFVLNAKNRMNFMLKSLKYEKYAQKVVEKLQKSQPHFIEKFDADNYANWFYNQSSETLRLYSDEKEIYFRYIPVGTFSLNTNTWMWAWANENSIEPRKFRTLEIKAFGEKKKYKNLTNTHFDGDKFSGWELTSIAFDIIGGIGTYRVVSDHLEKYFLITEQITKDELIECKVHGKIRRAFICQHLNTEQIIGFEEAFETYRGMELEVDDDLQAWCSECEKVRLNTDGWNDKSMEFANIKVVCERCYFEIKELNETLKQNTWKK